VIALAIRILESPDAHAREARTWLAKQARTAAAASVREWLILLGALAFTRPDLLDEDLLGSLAESFDREDTSGNLDLAGEIIKSLLDTGLAVPSFGLTVEKLRRPGAQPEVYETLAGVLVHAALWRPELLDVETVIGLAELVHLKPQRPALSEIAFESCLTTAPQLDASLLDRCTALFGGAHERYWEAVRRAHGFVPPAIGPPSIQPASRLREGRCRVLVVHNIGQGQGDEIIRCVPLMQALLDGNPELDIALVTQRPYLYSHPRLIVVRIGDVARTSNLFTERFDAVIDFYQQVVGGPSDTRLEEALQDFVRERPPFLWIWATNTDNHFIFEKITADGVDYAEKLGLHRRRVQNTYETTFRLISDLGLPLRFGEYPVHHKPVLAGLPSSEAQTGWQDLTAQNHSQRPIALLNPFGGAHRLKGYTELDGVAAEAARLIEEGFFVVVLPSGTSWGSAELARASIGRLASERQVFTAVGPDLSDDRQMSWLMEWIRNADLIVTVEGWMVHAAYCLGKPYRALMLPYSTPEGWSPYGRSPSQQVSPTAVRRPWAESSAACLPHQPRKRMLLLLLREIGSYLLDGARPILRRALDGDDRELRAAAARALVRLRDAADLSQLLRDPFREVRGIGAQASLDIGFRPCGFTKEQLMAHVWIGCRKLDWAPVVRLGQSARPALEMAAHGDDSAVRREAGQILRILSFKIPKKPGFFTRILGRQLRKESGVGP
jgi:ADP-heptose:LPS heptosyltransferase